MIINELLAKLHVNKWDSLEPTPFSIKYIPCPMSAAVPLDPRIFNIPKPQTMFSLQMVGIKKQPTGV